MIDVICRKNDQSQEFQNMKVQKIRYKINRHANVVVNAPGCKLEDRGLDSHTE